jgi:hypothetical protein
MTLRIRHPMDPTPPQVATPDVDATAIDTSD